MNKPIRLQKFLAQCGVCSRRKAEQYIKEGRVKVDGKLILEMGVQVDPTQNKVAFNNKLISVESELVYLLLNKPKGYVTTLSDPQGRPIVTSLIKDMSARLFPVGRLDFDTEGALLLTNDGALAQKVQHPSYNTNKSYEAVVTGSPDPEKIRHLEQGILLEGKMTSPAKVKILRKKGRNTILKIIIHEGRKRQIRKMCTFIGHHVIHLRRTAYGQLTLGRLALGEYRDLTPSEIKKIFL